MNPYTIPHREARAAAKRMLEREFNVRFLDEETAVALRGGESWKADLVSEDLRIVAEVKAMTFGGRVGSKIRGLATACLLLAGVQADRKLLVLSDPEMVAVFKSKGKRYWKVAEALGVEIRQLTYV